MRTSQYLLSTLKETPADAVVISHQLLLRAGMIRRLASGLYTWLPMGLRVLRKVETIVREEMNAAGALEVLMPAVQPAELWQESGRWEQYGPELLRLKDRHEREFCVGPTHEEVITDLARNELNSYKQLPINFYQIQTKFRDEIRPRFGLMRGREFIMKDAYSFHLSQDSLQQTYDKTITALVDGFQLPIEKTIKTLVVHGAEEGTLVALIVRGDHELNEIKAANQPLVASPLVFASEAEIRAAIGAGPGSLGPVNLPIACIVDRSVALMSDFAAGANIEDKHYFGVNWERDLPLPEVADLRNVVEGDPSPDGKGTLVIKRGIEVGHIFQLGTKYSEAMKLNVLSEQGKPVNLIMGCYGIGVSRVVAAAIEQNHDERGILWPSALAPFQIALVPLKYETESVKQATDKLYAELTAAGFEVLLDDRDKKTSPGVKFADMELIGIPHRIVISDRGLNEGVLEYKGRRDSESQNLPIGELMSFITEKLSR